MKKAVLPLLLAVVLIAAGGCVYWLYGYKDNIWLQGTAYLLMIFGWLIVFFLLLSVHMAIRKDARLKRLLYFIVYPLWLVGIVASFVAAEIAKDKRIDALLAKPDAKNTIATVTRLEERRRRSSRNVYAIIEYNTPAGKVQQAIRDNYGLYIPGQQLKIRYAGESPDMFRLEEAP